MGHECCGGSGRPGSAIKKAPAAGEVTNRCCGARDLGPLDEDWEGPSDDDVEAFSGVTRTCPECKTEVYDEAELCYNCGHAFGGTRSLPVWAMVTAALLVVGLTALFLW